MTNDAVRCKDVLEIGLVNNMPDQALPTTQRQFTELVREGAQGRRVNWRCYFLPGAVRSETARRFLGRSHENIERLYRRGADALIVTGAEPRAEHIEEEPYWQDLCRLVEWARNHTLSTIWSCLAAHAAVLRVDGVRRHRNEKKISGVFQFETTSTHWARVAGGTKVTVPHSRYNALSQSELERCGYHVASYSSQVGVDSFWRREPSLFVFLQGHPEYDANTLLKEYRRDVLRFLSGQRNQYPELPTNYFSSKTTEKLESLRLAAQMGIQPETERTLCEILTAEKCCATWSSDTVDLYRQWIDAIAGKMDHWREIA